MRLIGAFFVYSGVFMLTIFAMALLRNMPKPNRVACFNAEFSSQRITPTLNHNISSKQAQQQPHKHQRHKKEDQAQFIIVFKQLLEDGKNNTHINIMDVHNL
jgi:hypothetical protein